jgi:hypothetical protein
MTRGRRENAVYMRGKKTTERQQGYCTKKDWKKEQLEEKTARYKERQKKE